MSDPLAERILQRMSQVRELYFHLILVVEAPGVGKAKSLSEVARQIGLPSINASLELSRRMLDLSTRQRALKVASLLDDIITEEEGDSILLDNIELLYNPALRQDPLRLLQNLSKRKPIFVAWKGKIVGDYLTYAEPDHPEYRRYLTKDLVILNMDEPG